MDTMRQAICAALQSLAWSDAEKWVLRWQWQSQLGPLGGFETALAETITRADDDNLKRLRCGFPNEVDGYLAWSRGDLAQRFRAAGIMD